MKRLFSSGLAIIGVGLFAGVIHAQDELHHIGTHTGVVNGGELAATVDSFANRVTGEIAGSLHVTENPPDFHVGFSGFSLKCCSCVNGAGTEGDAENIYDILGGQGVYTASRTYSYPMSPGSSLSFTATFDLNSEVLVYDAEWSGDVTGMPTDIIDVAPYEQSLTPAGDGLIAIEGSADLVLSDGTLYPITWTGMYDLGQGHNLARAEVAAIDIDFTTNDNLNFELTGNAMLRIACYPDFDGDGSLDLFDFLEYVNVFTDGDDRADCEQDGQLDLFDFLCFVNEFTNGC